MSFLSNIADLFTGGKYSAAQKATATAKTAQQQKVNAQKTSTSSTTQAKKAQADLVKRQKEAAQRQKKLEEERKKRQEELKKKQEALKKEQEENLAKVQEVTKAVNTPEAQKKNQIAIDENITRLPDVAEKEYYKANPEEAKRVATQTEQASKDNAFLYNLLNSMQKSSYGLDTEKGLEEVTGQSIDSEKNVAGDIVGRMLGYATTAGVGEVGVAKNIIQQAAKTGAKKAPTLAKLGATSTAFGLPTNIIDSASTEGTTADKLKNFGTNLALDATVGTLMSLPDLRAVSKAQKSLPTNTAKSTEKAVKQSKNVLKQEDKSTLNELYNKATTKTTPTTAVATPAKEVSQQTLNPEDLIKIASKPTQKKSATNAAQGFTRQFVSTTGNIEKDARKLVKKGGSDAEVGERLLGALNDLTQSNKVVMNQIVNNQTDINFKKVGKSVKEIFGSLGKDEKTQMDFAKYSYLKQHIPRANQGKPVFEGLSVEDASKMIRDLEKQNPNFVETNKDLTNYMKGLNEIMVEGGTTPREQIEYLQALYPDYVPTYRTQEGGLGTAGMTPKSSIFTAKGSSKELLNLEEQVVKMTESVWSNATQNRVMKEIGDIFGYTKAGEKLTPKSAEEIAENIAMPVFEQGANGKPNTISYFLNGEKVTTEVPEKYFLDLKTTFESQDSVYRDLEGLLKVAEGLNSTFKALITSLSPIFTMKNLPKDMMDGLIYSQDALQHIKNAPESLKQQKQKSEAWKLWESSGGVSSSFFDKTKSLNAPKEWHEKGILGKIEEMNLFTEQIVRFNEFRTVLLKELDGKPISEATREMVSKASRAGADITVNFGRSGKTGKAWNRTAVPFFNPAIQGSEKLYRTLTGQNGFKGYMSLAGKLTLLGIAPSVLNDQLLKDDPDYQMLNQRDKDTNFLFKVGDSFIKIPKGRVIGTMGMPIVNATRQARGEDVDWAEVIGTMGSQVAPINPLESNILTPILDVQNNTTWYGTPIESESLQSLPQGERADESTTVLAKKLGELTGISPKKFDYLVDAYTGIIGDIAIPAMTPKIEGTVATGNPVVDGALQILGKGFTVDPVTQNTLSSKFYDNFEKAEQQKNSSSASLSDQAVSSHYSSYQRQISDISKQIKEVQAATNIDTTVKLEQVRDLREQQNKLYQEAMNNEEAYREEFDKAYSKYKDMDLAKDTASIETSSDPWAEVLTTSQFRNSENRQSYATQAEELGLSPVEFRDLYVDVGTSQADVYARLESTDLDTSAKASLWNSFNKGWKSNPYLTGQAPSSSGSSSGGSSYSGGSTKKVILPDWNPKYSSAMLTLLSKKLDPKLLIDEINKEKKS